MPICKTAYTTHSSEFMAGSTNVEVSCARRCWNAVGM